MEESYIEVLATHGGPDHALAIREGAAKRWLGVHAGRGMELPKGPRPGCRRGHRRGRQHRWWRVREPSASPAESENLRMGAISSC
jgi:hypothetical protein